MAVGVGAGSTWLRISRWMMIEVGRSWSVALYEEMTVVPDRQIGGEGAAP